MKGKPLTISTAVFKCNNYYLANSLINLTNLMYRSSNKSNQEDKDKGSDRDRVCIPKPKFAYLLVVFSGHHPMTSLPISRQSDK